jgi:hypothetical protein
MKNIGKGHCLKRTTDEKMGSCLSSVFRLKGAWKACHGHGSNLSIETD